MDIQTVAKLLRESRRVLFITGAGMSADSGLPTYRGVGGLYNDGGTADGVPIEVALSGPTFSRDPALTWKYISQIERACRGALPNAGHRAIAQLEASHGAWVLTQNVDGLHRAAGSKQVIDIHGGLHALHCTRCRWREEVQDYGALAPLPLCPECSAVVRPNVVLFSEMLDPSKVATLETQLDIGFDMVLSVGTTSVFPYIALPVINAKKRGVPTVEVNPGRTEVSSLVDFRLRGGAAETLSAIVEACGF